MNKQTGYFLSIVFAVGVIFISCSDKKHHASESDSTSHHEADATHEDWTEMDDFHNIMAESFHPYKDSMNLAPAKANAAAMAASAEKWAGAPLPEKVNNEEVKSKLQSLKANTAAFVETAKSSDDKVVGEALTKLHDQFHEIQEAWYGGHGHHH